MLKEAVVGVGGERQVVLKEAFFFFLGGGGGRRDPFRPKMLEWGGSRSCMLQTHTSVSIASSVSN